jgi:hypothetical protein
MDVLVFRRNFLALCMVEMFTLKFLNHCSTEVSSKFLQGKRRETGSLLASVIQTKWYPETRRTMNLCNQRNFEEVKHSFILETVPTGVGCCRRL